MSDPATSETGTPAASDPASPAPAAVGATQPFGTFGSTRGSGLARGKRPGPANAPAANAASAGYQPSSIEVITSKSEYKNPFTGETSVASPASPEPVARIVNEPAPQAAPTPAPARVIVQATAPAAQPAPAPVAPSQELFPLDPAARVPAAAPEAKVALKILPPEDTKRPAQSWESSPQPRRDERPSFRPERREPRALEPREPRQHRDPREGGDLAPRAPQPEAPREYRQPRPEPPKASGGFFAWLKGLFGGSPTAPVPQTQSGEPRRDRDGEYRQGRRRHRGGRGRQQNYNGPRDGQQPQGGSSEGGRPQGGEYRQGDDSQRRRRRGGRGRFRDDRGGDPHSDGQQGGGAI